jgi:putative chitinase
MAIEQLRSYRQLALARLRELVFALPQEAHGIDYWLDQTIRNMSGLPERSDASLPYRGLYGKQQSIEDCSDYWDQVCDCHPNSADGLEWCEYRDVACDRLEELLGPLTNLHKVDRELDHFIRRLSDLPPRSAKIAPYAGLFTLRSPNAQPDELRFEQHIEQQFEQQLLPQSARLVSSVACPAHHNTQNLWLYTISTIAGQLSLQTESLVTVEQLVQIAGTAQMQPRIHVLASGINATLITFNINTPLRMAHFLAQIMDESCGFRYLREQWGPTAWQETYEPPSKLARKLGNTEVGDGQRFMGRGLLPILGREAYLQFSKAMHLGNTLVERPELLESAPLVALAAGWYWHNQQLNEVADRDDLLEVTRRINPNLPHLQQRERYLKRAKLVLKRY